MVEVQFRNYFSIQHLKSAYLLNLESKKLENLDLSHFDGLEKVDLISKNMAFVTGSLFTTVSFLEATIREVLCDILEEKERTLYLPLQDREAIKSEWYKQSRDSLEKLSILKKYQKTLELLNLEVFENGSELFIDLDNIIKVRNSLIHYKPEDYSIHSPFVSEINNQFELTKFLDGKFAHSVFYIKSGNPFFPDKCLGYGFAKWSLQNAILFVDNFHDRIRLKPIYEHIKKDIRL